jgi:NADPH:quinone reductase-like Zn-dependent oxidoreductase
MRAYELQDTSGLAGMELINKPVPQPAVGQVLVRIRAVTLNHRDLLTVKGGYGSRQKLPLIPLSDAAGVVEAVGPGVQHFKVSDRVIGSFFKTGPVAAPRKKSRTVPWAVRLMACLPNIGFFDRKPWCRRRRI